MKFLDFYLDLIANTEFSTEIVNRLKREGEVKIGLDDRVCTLSNPTPYNPDETNNETHEKHTPARTVFVETNEGDYLVSIKCHYKKSALMKKTALLIAYFLVCLAVDMPLLFATFFTVALAMTVF